MRWTGIFRLFTLALESTRNQLLPHSFNKRLSMFASVNWLQRSTQQKTTQHCEGIRFRCTVFSGIEIAGVLYDGRSCSWKISDDVLLIRQMSSQQENILPVVVNPLSLLFPLEASNTQNSRRHGLHDTSRQKDFPLLQKCVSCRIFSSKCRTSLSFAALWNFSLSLKLLPPKRHACRECLVSGVPFGLVPCDLVRSTRMETKGLPSVMTCLSSSVLSEQYEKGLVSKNNLPSNFQRFLVLVAALHNTPQYGRVSWASSTEGPSLEQSPQLWTNVEGKKANTTRTCNDGKLLCFIKKTITRNNPERISSNYISEISPKRPRYHRHRRVPRRGWQVMRGWHPWGRGDKVQGVTHQWGGGDKSEGQWHVSVEGWHIRGGWHINGGIGGDKWGGGVIWAKVWVKVWSSLNRDLLQYCFTTSPPFSKAAKLLKFSNSSPFRPIWCKSVFSTGLTKYPFWCGWLGVPPPSTTMQSQFVICITGKHFRQTYCGHLETQTVDDDSEDVWNQESRQDTV